MSRMDPSHRLHRPGIRLLTSQRGSRTLLELLVLLVLLELLVLLVSQGLEQLQEPCCV